MSFIASITFDPIINIYIYKIYKIETVYRYEIKMFNALLRYIKCKLRCFYYASLLCNFITSAATLKYTIVPR